MVYSVICTMITTERLVHAACVQGFKVRVTNLKSDGMQNQSTSVFSVRSLGKIETCTLQIGETLGKFAKSQY